VQVRTAQVERAGLPDFRRIEIVEEAGSRVARDRDVRAALVGDPVEAIGQPRSSV